MSIAILIDRAVVALGSNRAELLGLSRSERLVRARDAIVHVASIDLGRSSPSIGKQLNRDHTTIITARRRAERWVQAKDQDFIALVGQLRAELAKEATMKESGVESYLKNRVEGTGGICRKVVFPGRRGAPDRLCGWPESEPSDIYGVGILTARPARFGMVETKRPGGTPRAEQEREHARLRAIGIRVDVIDTREQVDAYIAEMTA
jgi:hypothetical protein